MKKSFAYGAATQQGAWPRQEDAYYLDPIRSVFLLVDALGGKAGAEAAKSLIHSFRDFLSESYKKEMVLGKKAEIFFQEFSQKLHSANEKEQKKAAVSFIAGFLKEKEPAYILSSGACGAALLRNGFLHPMVLPQVTDLLQTEASFPYSALGLHGGTVNIQKLFINALPGDYLFFASGGFSLFRENFSASFLGALAEHPQNLAQVAQSLLQMTGAQSSNQSLCVMEWNNELTEALWPMDASPLDVMPVEAPESP